VRVILPNLKSGIYILSALCYYLLLYCHLSISTQHFLFKEPKHNYLHVLFNYFSLFLTKTMIYMSETQIWIFNFWLLILTVCKFDRFSKIIVTRKKRFSKIKKIKTKLYKVYIYELYSNYSLHTPSKKTISPSHSNINQNDKPKVLTNLFNLVSFA
jgi:deoxyadenosine/deoxycytidine kinase